LTGVNESWTDSAVHVAGSLAAAEVGGRLSGRGSFLTGSTAGPRQFALMDTKASAEFYAREGYGTTGKLMDLLKSQGYLNESESFRQYGQRYPALRESHYCRSGTNAQSESSRSLREGSAYGCTHRRRCRIDDEGCQTIAGVKHDELAARIARLMPAE